MGRKKIVVGGETVAPAATKQKAEPYEISAAFSVKDQEGNRVKLRYVGKGDTVVEALASLKDEDNNPFPKGLNVLVLTVVKHGDKIVEVSLAPHRVRQILEHHDMVLFVKHFGKI